MSEATKVDTDAPASNEIELNNVGPIKHLTIPCPEDGGVIVIRGRNGTGKTHAVDSVESLYSKNARAGLRKRDGVPSGTIEGMGVTIRLGRVNTQKGKLDELIAESIDGRVDPSMLVDPGIKDPVKADAKRLQSLIRLGNVKVSAEKWTESLAEAADKVAVKDLIDDDPILTCDRIRRRLHEVAREQEKLAESKAAESASISKMTEGVNVEAPHDDDMLSKALDVATAELARAESKRDSYVTAKYQIDEAAKLLDSIDVIDLNPFEADLEASKSILASADKELDATLEQIKELEAKANTLAETRKQQMMVVKHQSEKLEAAKIKNADHDKFLAATQMSVPETVSSTDYDALVQSKHDAKEALKYGQTVRQALSHREKAKGLEDESISLAKTGSKFREMAKSTDSVLEEAIVDAGFDAIKIHDGRLCVESDRAGGGLEPFDELSHGERWSMALDMAAAGMPAGSVLPVCQEAFEALDPTNRDKLSKLAKDRGLVIVTAEATDGDLRAEVL